MKICILTNYLPRKDSVNELLIFKSLIETLKLSSSDIFKVTDRNCEYIINKKYTHVLVLLDYEMLSIRLISDILEEISIPKIFIIDSVAEYHRELDDYFTNNIVGTPVSTFTGVPLHLQTYLYDEYADSFIFYTELDQVLFSKYYILKNKKRFTIIPPSLESIKSNSRKVKQNTSIGFNGTPSFANGLYNFSNIIKQPSIYSLNIYGSHGRGSINNELLLNHLTATNSYIRFKGKLKNRNAFLEENHIYYNIPVYNTFNYPCYESILGGMIPIIGNTSPEAKYFIEYPFITELEEHSIKQTLSNITESTSDYLQDIVEHYSKLFKTLNNENINQKYIDFLKAI